MATAMLAAALPRAQQWADIAAASTSRRRAPTVRELARKIRALERRIDRFTPDQFDRECCGGPTDELYPTFTKWTRSTPGTLLLGRSSVNLRACPPADLGRKGPLNLGPGADPGCFGPAGRSR